MTVRAFAAAVNHRLPVFSGNPRFLLSSSARARQEPAVFDPFDELLEHLQ